MPNQLITPKEAARGVLEDAKKAAKTAFSDKPGQVEELNAKQECCLVSIINALSRQMFCQ